MTYRPWLCTEEDALRYLAHLGARELAIALDRPIGSVKTKARRLRVSLRRKRNAPDLPLACEATLRRIRDAVTAPLCPACAARPATVRRTGMCAPCHLETLTRIHEEAIATADAQRALWAARSKLRRRRRSLGQEAART